MATYKVMQDVEAEDKLVGPLSLRQFVYAGACALCLYFTFIVVSKGVAFMAIIFLPPALFCGFFAFPWSREQPTELWALAKIRFMLKPRKRVWNQSGMKELVTITAPKKIERVVTNGLSQAEVRSRLNALASTIDSHGWAVKNVNVNLSGPQTTLVLPSTDRLVEPSMVLPNAVSNVDITASDDMLDPQNNRIAQQFDSMISAASQAHRQQIESQLQGNAPLPQQPASGQQGAPADYWFLNQPATGKKGAPIDAAFLHPQMVYPGTEDDGRPLAAKALPTPTEEEIIRRSKEQANPYNFAYSHLKNIQPLGTQNNSQPTPQQQPAAEPMQQSTQQTQSAPMTPTTDPAKIELANRNDLNISTIARLANGDDTPDGEIVVNLH